MVERNSVRHFLPQLETEEFRLRFWSKVSNLFGGGCWQWTAGGSGDYGRVGLCYGGRKASFHAHRVAYAIVAGDVPDHLQVCHRCDNTICVRPDHLFLGTNDDNRADMFAKGRWRYRIAPPERRPCGERSRTAKLSNKQAQEIRDRYAAGGVRMRELAAEYGAHVSTVCRIIHMKRYQYDGAEARPLPVPVRTSCRGSLQGASLLKEADIPVIREAVRSGRSMCSVAREYRVSDSTIASVVKGRTWKHVT